MAAQKLTKSRLVQIIIMLSLLIIAFTWRTITYKTERNILCNPKNTCSFELTKESLVVTNYSTDITINTPENLTIKAAIIEGNGKINQLENEIVVIKQSDKVKLKISAENEIVYLTLLN